MIKPHPFTSQYIYCPQCKSPNLKMQDSMGVYRLGVLKYQRTNYRCQDCGLQFSRGMNKDAKA